MGKRKYKSLRGGRIFNCRKTQKFYGKDLAEIVKEYDLKTRPGMHLNTDMKEYCKKREFYEDVPGSGVISNRTCIDIPLTNLYSPYKQFALGRMNLLNDKNYYNCTDRFRTLEVQNWNVYLNDLFIECTYIDREDYDFPVRIITDYTTDPYTPQIYKYDDHGIKSRVQKGDQLYGVYRVEPDKRDICSLSPKYGIIDNILTNRELCQMYSQGIKLWQCITPDFEYLFFVSYKQNYSDYDVTITNGQCKIHDTDTRIDYTFKDVTDDHECIEFSHSPSVAPATGSPSVAPSSGSPSVAPSSGSPSVAPLTGSPSVAPLTGSPSVAPSTGGSVSRRLRRKNHFRRS